MTKFRQQLIKAGFHRFGLIDHKAATSFLHVSSRTLERWIADDKPCPRALALLDARLNGWIPQTDVWQGFYIDNDGNLNTPDGKRYPANYLRKVWIFQQNQLFQERTINALKDEVKALKNLSLMRERIKDMGQELIDISDTWKLLEKIAARDSNKDTEKSA